MHFAGCFLLFKERAGHASGSSCRGSSTGRHRQAPGKPERNAVPRKGDSMGKARAGNWHLKPPAEYHIFSVHTAVPSKGAAGFFYSTHFYLFPKQNTKKYTVFIMSVSASVRMRFFCALVRLIYRERAPPLQS